jgi:hypothetical protein
VPFLPEQDVATSARDEPHSQPLELSEDQNKSHSIGNGKDKSKVIRTSNKSLCYTLPQLFDSPDVGGNDQNASGLEKCVQLVSGEPKKSLPTSALSSQRPRCFSTELLYSQNDQESDQSTTNKIPLAGIVGDL